MDYELFKKVIRRRIKEYLPPIFHDYEPVIHPVAKINGTKDAFCLFPPGNKPNVAVPTLYLDDMYDSFAYDEDLERILQTIAGVFIRWSGVEVPELASFDVSHHTDRIVANLINMDMNEDLMLQVPHTKFQDMLVIYRLIHSVTPEGINSAIITNEMIADTDLTVKDLHEAAMKNTPNIFPPRTIESEDKEVLIVTNELGINGATVMVYSDFLQTLAQKLDGDFFIMPTSIHEFFAVTAEDSDPEHLIRMLAAGNDTVTSRDERLSCSVYHYSAKEDKLRIAASYRAEPEFKMNDITQCPNS